MISQVDDRIKWRRISLTTHDTGKEVTGQRRERNSIYAEFVMPISQP